MISVATVIRAKLTDGVVFNDVSIALLALDIQLSILLVLFFG